jgi:hypothetical protein
MPCRTRSGARYAARPPTETLDHGMPGCGLSAIACADQTHAGMSGPDAVRGHRFACAVRAIDGLVRIAQRLRPCDRQRGQRDVARADSHTAARLAESRHISSPIPGGGVRVAQAARGEGFTNTTKTEEVSK